MSRALIISDIHLGDQRFNCYDKLKHLLLTETYDQLILAGDIIDLFLCSWEEIVKSDFFVLLNEISKTKSVVWVYGNHDNTIIKYSEYLPNILITEFYELESAGKKFLILHGNQSYRKREESLLIKVSARLNYFLWRILKIDLQNINDRMEYHKRHIYAKRLQLMAMFGSQADVIVSAHSHAIGCLNYCEKDLYDIGAFIKNSYAIIENGKVKIEVAK